MATPEPMDLIDIATLLNYERVSREPRLRHAKLFHFVRPHEHEKSQTLQHMLPSEVPQDDIHNDRTWISLENKGGDDEQPDLPSNMVNENAPPLSFVADEELESIYYRARHQNSSFSSVYLLQCFFNLFPPDTPLRVRHEPRDAPIGAFSYTTSISHRMGISDKLVHPKNSTMVVNDIAENKTSFEISGHEPLMEHATMGFRPLESEFIMSVLDLSSMQFGDVGRGPGQKGNMPFAMDHASEWHLRGREYSLGRQDRRYFDGLEASYLPEDTAYVEDVARRTKERWEKRDTEKWCACCGAPAPKFKCSGCGKVWFCDRVHQKNVWPHHKGYCNKESVGMSVEDMDKALHSKQSAADRAMPKKSST